MPYTAPAAAAVAIPKPNAMAETWSVSTPSSFAEEGF